MKTCDHVMFILCLWKTLIQRWGCHISAHLATNKNTAQKANRTNGNNDNNGNEEINYTRVGL